MFAHFRKITARKPTSGDYPFFRHFCSSLPIYRAYNDLRDLVGNQLLASNMLTVLVRGYHGGTLEIQIDRKSERSDSAQRRQSPRIRLQVPVFLRGVDTSGVEFIELTKTLNISATGACIASTHYLRPDQIVSITVPAPSPSSSVVPNETPPISARILRQSVAGDIRLFGLEFLRPLE